MKRFLKKFVEVLSEIHKKALKVQILNEVVLRHAGGSENGLFLRSQGRKYTKFSGIEIWY